MKQLFMQKTPASKANLIIEDVPSPRCGQGDVLIQNHFSLISAGTETASVKRNIKDMVVKAMTDPDIRDSVKDMLVKDGIRKTADRVHYETSKWTPMGYSGAGLALEVGKDVDGIGPGDFVAYGGQGHAEIIRAPKNLCVRIPDGVEARSASFVAVGGIAMQAVRRAGIQVGESVAVLGLGLVGQLVGQLITCAGGRVIGTDFIEERRKLALSLGMEKAFTPGETLPEEIRSYTEGLGIDHVIICAATSSGTVVEQAVAMARDKARITVVGMIPLDVPCEEFYMKELDLVISRSYGPGRYDVRYEQHGQDYPIGYVRWTEQRNMVEFLRMVGEKKINVDSLISHEFDLENSAEAYDTLIGKPNECLAIVLKYKADANAIQRRLPVKPVNVTSVKQKSNVNVAVIGCGAFARQFHLPNIKAHKDLNLKMIVASSGQSAKEMAIRYGAENCASDVDEAINDPEIDAVMIFTRDNTHAPIALSALKAGKHVFCEKPLAVSEKECADIAEALKKGGPICMTGFNRRFSPLILELKKMLMAHRGPKMIHCRVNAGALPKDNWVFDSAYAAGRIVGEGCHFVDLMAWLVGAEPTSVHAQAVGDSPSLTHAENISATFRFEEGSIGTLLYTALGSTSYPKERLELYVYETVMVMDDYHTLNVRGRRRRDLKKRNADKGHTAEITHFAEAATGKVRSSITYLDGIRGTIGALKIWESVKSSEVCSLNINNYLS